MVDKSDDGDNDRVVPKGVDGVGDELGDEDELDREALGEAPTLMAAPMYNSEAPPPMAVEVEDPDEIEAAAVERKARGPKAALAAIPVVVALLLAIASYLAYAVTAEESARWITADQTGDAAAWSSYVTWAEVTRVHWLNGLLSQKLTPIEDHLAVARDRALTAEAHEASEAEDWPTLCELRDANIGATAGTRASEALTSRAMNAGLAYRRAASQRHTPSDSLEAIVAAMIWRSQQDPCGPGATLRVEHEVSGGAFEELVGGETIESHIEALLTEERATALVEALIGDFDELTGGTLPTHFATMPDEGSPLDVVLRMKIEPEGTFATPDGTTLPGIRIAVSAVISGPEPVMTAPDTHADTLAGRPLAAATYRLPANFAIELFREASNADGAETGPLAIYQRMLELLYPSAGGRLGQVLGVTPFDRRPGTVGANCSSAAVLTANHVLSGTTFESHDSSIGGCLIEEEDYDPYEECYDEDCSDMLAPEEYHRLVITSRSEVGIEVRSDFSAALYVRATCSSVDELACDPDNELLSTTLDEGVYYVYVDGAFQGERGAYELYASVVEPTAIAAACEARETLSVGEPINSTVGGATDALWGQCGGVGGRERLYSMRISEQSRTRCSVSGSSADLVTYMRSACTDRDSELACTITSNTDHEGQMSALLGPGDYTVGVDTYFGGGRPSFSLLCETSPPAGRANTPNNRCGSVEPVAFNDGSARLEFDTFTAEDSITSTCGGAGSADVVRRIDVASTSYFRASRHSGFRGRLALYRGCGADASQVVCGTSAGAIATQLEPGTYYLVIDGDNERTFGAGTLNVSLTDLLAVCASAETIRGEDHRSAIVANPPSRFVGSCGGEGPETVSRFQISERSRVRLNVDSTQRSYLYIRRQCTDVESEVACIQRSSELHEIDEVLDPGTYYVFLDAASSNQHGAANLDLTVEPVNQPVRVP